MSQYDQSNSFYGGGGYLTGGSPFSASGSPGGARRTEISHSLRPLTIAQLNKASQAHADAEWRIDDVEIGQVTVVGQVISIQAQTTNSLYTIDDGTGRIEARHWVVDPSNNEKWGKVEENTYVRVTGGLKSFGKKRYINTSNIRHVKDAHEVYFHTLEAISINLIIERGPPSNPGLAMQPKTPTTTANSGQSASISAYSAQSNTAAARDQLAHLNTLQKSIIHFIMDQPQTDEGVHVAAIAKAIGASNEDARKISDALDILMDEGHVYTTIDDSHFNVSL